MKTIIVLSVCLFLSCIAHLNGFAVWKNLDTRRRGLSRIPLRQHSDANHEASDHPTVAVVGSGAVGCYYGTRLWECGYNVKFHMRGDHFKSSVKNGLNVTSVYGDVFIPPDSLEAYETTQEMGKADWVLVALKSSSLDAIPELILPLLQQDRTRVLLIMNGLIEEDLLEHFKLVSGKEPTECCTAFYGGMALICCNRIEPGWVDHSYAGLLTGGVAASSSQDADADREAFEELWKSTKVEIAYEPALLRGRWTKNVWNLPFNGISVSMGGITVDKIVTDPGLRRLAYIIMDETIAAANADLAFHGEDSSNFLGAAEKKKMMDLSDGMGEYKTSTMLDLLERRPMEVKYLFRKPLERAQKLNVPAPHLETVVAQIEAMQRFHDLY